MNLVIDTEAASRVLRQAMLDQDLGIKEAAHRIRRSSGTVKRALAGSMGPRTAYRILKEFGEPPVLAGPARSGAT